MRFVNFPKEFYIVLYPSKSDSKIEDLIIKTNLFDFSNFVLNKELDTKDIYGIYGPDQKNKVKNDAKALISQLKNGEIEAV